MGNPKPQSSQGKRCQRRPSWCEGAEAMIARCIPDCHAWPAMRVERKTVLGCEFADAHKAVERRTTGSPHGGAADGRDVQGRSNNGEMSPLDGKPMKSGTGRFFSFLRTRLKR